MGVMYKWEQSFCVNEFPIRAVIFFTLALGILESLQKKILFHTVCCESMFPTSSNIIFVSCFFQGDNMALWVAQSTHYHELIYPMHHGLRFQAFKFGNKRRKQFHYL
jgi:hypothetical protein